MIVGPASVTLVEYRNNSVRVEAAANLRELVAYLLLNSGDEFAFWAESEASKAAQVWRDGNKRDAEREASGIHDGDCECDACVEAYDKAAADTVASDGGRG